MNGPTAIIILAAGSSARLGRPKQLLPFKNTTLIGHLAHEAIKAGTGPVIIVAGAACDEVRLALDIIPVQIVFNRNWHVGMGESIAAGIRSLSADCSGAILCVCDQPFVEAGIFSGLVTEQRRSGKGIVACTYAGTVGTPVLFRSQYFSPLSRLTGETGGKRIIKDNEADLATISFDAGALDIDTEADYAQCLKIKTPV